MLRSAPGCRTCRATLLGIDDEIRLDRGLAVFMAFTLLLNRRATHLPKNLIQITVPLAMSYYLFLYGTVNLMPLELRENLMSVEWQVPAAVAAVVVSMVGYAISLWGLCSLGRSFAIFVRFVASLPGDLTTMSGIPCILAICLN